VFHYYTPRQAIVGFSVATADLTSGTINWTPHWTKMTNAERAKRNPGIRPAWIRKLRDYRDLDTPLSLAAIQKSEKFVRDFIKHLSKRKINPLILFQDYPGQLRAVQGGYVTKMPAAFVAHWPILRNAVDQFSALNSQATNSAEVNAATLELVEEHEAKQGRSAQSFVADPKVRKTIERHAVDRAMIFFEAEGFNDIVEKGKPYDLLCRRQSGNELFVEVKGTTTDGEEIFLTANEVSHYKQHAPNTALYVLSKINLIHENENVSATGGTEKIYWPWRIDEEKLTAFAFTYKLGPK